MRTKHLSPLNIAQVINNMERGEAKQLSEMAGTRKWDLFSRVDFHQTCRKLGHHCHQWRYETKSTQVECLLDRERGAKYVLAIMFQASVNRQTVLLTEVIFMFTQRVVGAVRQLLEYLHIVTTELTIRNFTKLLGKRVSYNWTNQSPHISHG